MLSLGETIRQLREEKELPLPTVAAYLDIDQAIMSKIERGQRIANSQLVVKLAAYLNFTGRIISFGKFFPWSGQKIRALVQNRFLYKQKCLIFNCFYKSICPKKP